MLWHDGESEASKEKMTVWSWQEPLSGMSCSVKLAEGSNNDLFLTLLKTEIFLSESRFKQKSVIHASERRNQRQMRF